MGTLLLYWLTKLLIGLFLLGLFGSAVVVVITFIEDGLLLLDAGQPRIRTEAAEAETRRAKLQEAFR
jgi:hypothetical protein